MKLGHIQLSKADPNLRRALANAEAKDTLRALVMFQNNDEQDEPEIRPVRQDFDSASDYRKALVEWSDNRFQRRHRSAIDSLVSLRLNPVELPSTGTVVVEGRAENIAAALDIPGIHVVLDRALVLERPVRSKANGTARRPHRK